MSRAKLATAALLSALGVVGVTGQEGSIYPRAFDACPIAEVNR